LTYIYYKNIYKLDLIIQLVDKTPYVWWKDNESTLDKDTPFYCKKIPDVSIIQQSGCNCAGLINLIHLSRGLTVPGTLRNDYYAGGTYSWYEYLNGISALEPINTDSEYTSGSLLIRKYRSPDDQGHLAILYTTGKLLEQKLLHCYPGAGIKIDDTVKESHNWIAGGYYEYICVGWLQRP